MTTSSIFANIKITEPEKIEAFVASLDASIADPMPRPNTPRKTVLSDLDEIRKLWNNFAIIMFYGNFSNNNSRENLNICTKTTINAI